MIILRLIVNLFGIFVIVALIFAACVFATMK